MVARCELPPASVADDDRLLSDLHLSSIAAAQLVAEAARRCNLPPPLSLTDYADATLGEVAEALDDLERSGGGLAATELAARVSGVDR